MLQQLKSLLIYTHPNSYTSKGSVYYLVACGFKSGFGVDFSLYIDSVDQE